MNMQMMQGPPPGHPGHGHGGPGPGPMHHQNHQHQNHQHMNMNMSMHQHHQHQHHQNMHAGAPIVTEQDFVQSEQEQLLHAMTQQTLQQRQEQSAAKRCPDYFL